MVIFVIVCTKLRTAKGHGKNEKRWNARAKERKNKIYVFSRNNVIAVLLIQMKKKWLVKICKYSHIMPPYSTAIQSAKLLKEKRRKKEERKRKKEMIERISLNFFYSCMKDARSSNEKISVSQQNLYVNCAYYLCGPLTKCSILQF